MRLRGPGPMQVRVASAAVCTKHHYPDQASARRALARVLEKARRKARPGAKLPRRVYPCDRCDGWHLTAKKVSGKTPPWDLDPNWTRP
jgi:hypothetical protein